MKLYERSSWGYPVVRKSVPQRRIKIQTVSDDGCNCPRCSSVLIGDRKGALYVPISPARAVELPFFSYCEKCDVCYCAASMETYIKPVLYDNRYAWGFSLNGKRYSNMTQWIAQKEQRERERAELEQTKQLQSRLTCFPESSVLLLFQTDAGEEISFIIVSDRYLRNEQERVFYLTSDIALRLLTAADYYRNDWIEIREYGHLMFKCKIPHPDCDLWTNSIGERPEICLRKNGGYAIPDRCQAEEENVFVLLYSPFSRRYEPVQATYNKRTRMYYMDPGLFRRFIHQFGKPLGTEILFSLNNGNYFDFGNLNEKSILMIYGYSVSEKEGLSDGARQSLLAELIDLKILLPAKIETHLCFCIKMHPDDWLAKAKWEADRDFVIHYKVNPKRFVVGGQVRKL